MKKFCSILLALSLTAGLFSGCGSTAAAPSATAAPAQTPGGSADSENGQRLSVVTTIFPEYDWMRQLLGSEADRVDLTLLLDSGVDLHSYQPTVEDIVKVSTCDLFVYVGGESDAWVEDILRTAENPDLVAIDLLEVLGDAVKAEELVEGMQEPAEEHDHADGEAGEEEEELDEHVWLSLKNAQTLCGYMAQQLAALDPDHAEAYAANAQAYLAELAALDAEYQAAVDGAAHKAVLFGDRFPFRYLVDDYGLDYYAAFVGCSAETEASFETVAFLAAKVDELGLPCVLTIEGAQHKIAETIVQNTAAKDQQVLTMDSMQSVTAADVALGKTYLSIMQKNLEVLQAALQG